MIDLILFGAGDLAKLIIQLIEDINRTDNRLKIIGFYDENPKITTFMGLRQVKRQELKDAKYFCIGVASPKAKQNVFSFLSNSNPNAVFPNLIHPSIDLPKSVLFNSGLIMLKGSCIDPFVSIGNHVLINKLCSIGHDSSIGDFSSISPGACIGGYNRIGKGVFWGIGACSIQHLNIGDGAILGAGAVLIRDVNTNALVVGNPAKEK
jgi:sugar O-acyltransferase (sialic acid O-acetyltransferase NeuD family)